MRILFHVHSLQAGGAERQLAMLADALAIEGHQIHVVTFQPGGPFWADLEHRGRCTLASLDRRGRLDFAIVFRLASYIRRHHIDLVQGWMPPANAFAAIACVLTRRPVVFGIRASFVNWPTAGGRLYVQLERWLSRLVARRIVCNSKAGKDEHAKLGYPLDKMQVIPNAISSESRSDLPAPFSASDQVRLGIVARLDPMKDHLTAFSALRVLADAGIRAELHLFGDGPNQYREQLEAAAEREGVSAQVRWHGHVKNVPAALGGIDVLLSTSIGEGMSNAIMEGMQAGRVIVSTDVGDAREMLQSDEGLCGYLVPARQPVALASAIKAILEDKDRAVRQGLRAREIAQSRYGLQATVAAYDSLYAAVVSSATRQSTL